MAVSLKVLGSFPEHLESVQKDFVDEIRTLLGKAKYAPHIGSVTLPSITEEAPVSPEVVPEKAPPAKGAGPVQAPALSEDTASTAPAEGTSAT